MLGSDAGLGKRSKRVLEAAAVAAAVAFADEAARYVWRRLKKALKAIRDEA